MQKAEQILQAMRKMGEKRIPLTRVYRSLYSEDLFLTAYDKIARNKGALTQGTEEETVDGMSMRRIRNVIEQLRYERFRFRPSRRIQIPKKSGGSRPLSIPNFSEKLVQEALRMLLEAYYEPRFLDSSHGFRPGRGCHTALATIKRKFIGTVWLIEGDIRGCFDNISREVLVDILSEDIHDGRLLNLIRRCIEAGYVEDWQYNKTYSGVPQGGIISPLLSNVYMHKLDEYIEEELVPQYTRGKRRANDPEYQRLGQRIARARRQEDRGMVRKLEQQRRQIPSGDTRDPNYRRLKYCRYADDFVLGFIGPKAEAEAIKTAIGAFLKEKLHLEMSETKTLITHTRTQKACFLGYTISVYHSNSTMTRELGTQVKRRSINGMIRPGIPYGRVDEAAKRYQRNGKPIHEPILLEHSDAHIISTFQARFRGLAEYYKYAVDRRRLGKLKHVMETALTKTLANKHKTSVAQIYRKYKGTKMVDGYNYKTLQVEVPTKEGTQCIYWGAIPLRVVKVDVESLDDRKKWDETVLSTRTDLVQRLQADQCELCGSQKDCEVHHIRKLIGLKKRWRGRKEKPAWVKRMIALRRKTLVVCRKCHDDIHAGRPTPKKRK
ncbi:MAG: reverse transcriptase domain-containing protein [Chloroflexota bacterium]|nr:reverse transcriptase domain-containing protein [Chloroflexota bacterium]